MVAWLDADRILRFPPFRGGQKNLGQRKKKTRPDTFRYTARLIGILLNGFNRDIPLDSHKPRKKTLSLSIVLVVQ